MSDFERMRFAKDSCDAFVYALELSERDGVSLRREPRSDRLWRLAKPLRNATGVRHGLEGTVTKR